MAESKGLKFTAEIDGMELACIIAEACIGMKRPPGVTAAQALSEFPADSRAGFILAAERAAKFMLAAINTVKPVN